MYTYMYICVYVYIYMCVCVCVSFGLVRLTSSGGYSPLHLNPWLFTSALNTCHGPTPQH